MASVRLKSQVPFTIKGGGYCKGKTPSEEDHGGHPTVCPPYAWRNQNELRG